MFFLVRFDQLTSLKYSNDIQNQNGNGGPLLSDGMSAPYPVLSCWYAQLDILQMVNLGYFNALNIWLFEYLEYFFMA